MILHGKRTRIRFVGPIAVGLYINNFNSTLMLLSIVSRYESMDFALSTCANNI